MGCLELTAMFFAFNTAYFCLSLELAALINSLLSILITVVIDILIMNGLIDSFVSNDGSGQLKALSATFGFISVLNYVCCCLLIVGLSKRVKWFMIPQMVSIPYILIISLFVFIKLNNYIMHDVVGAGNVGGHVGIYILAVVLIVFMIYSWAIAVRLYKTIGVEYLNVTVTRTNRTDPERGFPPCPPPSPSCIEMKTLQSSQDMAETMV